MESKNRNLQSLIQDYYGLDLSVSEEILLRIGENITKGKVRFVVLMDYLEDRLKDLITFINKNSNFDVLGVELEYYEHQGFEILIPKLHGVETMKVGVGGERRIWDEQSFFKDVEEKLTLPESYSVKKLFAFSKAEFERVTWGTSPNRGSFSPKSDYIHPGKSLYTVYSDGTLELNFQWLRDNAQAIPFVDRFAQELSSAHIFALSEGFEEKNPKIGAKDWVPHVDRLVEIIRSVVQRQ